MCVCRNYWTTTTGRLINRLAPNIKDRLDTDAFEAAWKQGPADPMKALALAALGGDPIALDALHDTVTR